MQSSALHFARVLSLLPLLFNLGASHGALLSPRPRNNDPTSISIDYGVKFRLIQGGVAWDDFNVHTCVGGFQTAAEFRWGTCVPAAHHHGLAYRVSYEHPPAGKVIDCTPQNSCSNATGSAAAEAPTDDSSGLVWLSMYDDHTCTSEPTSTFKINIDTCTQFPVNGKHYWTGGCEGFSCMWFSQGCCIGCSNCTGDTKHFFKNLCGSQKKPTIVDPQFLTFNRHGTDPEGDWTSSHPWRAPGSAPVLDACGVAGGFVKNNEGPGGHPPPGHNWGDKGSELPPVDKTIWKAGSIVEVSWGIAANHGGGYQYRLCPKSADLSERCFQQLPIPFAGGTQTLRLGNGTSIEIAATYVSSGTLPEGSTWAMNPVPACGDATPGTYNRSCRSPQFPPPPGCDETCWGDSDETFRARGHTHAVLPTIVDRLRVPAELEPGDYVLGWRWDCEQTAQIWSSCSDVVIVSGDSVLV